MKQKIAWINTVKSLCMIGVYVLHTQVYSGAQCNGGGNLLISNAISPFYVNAFFVVSGYLFFMKWMNVSSTEVGLVAKRSLSNTLHRLIIPTLLFSTVIYIPKLMFHTRELTALGYLHDVFGGVSFWFTSAMAISQIAMLLFILAGIRTIKGFSVLSLLIVATICLIKPLFPEPFPWYWKTGLTATAAMTLGGWIYHFRNKIKTHRYLLTSISMVCYLLAVWYGVNVGSARYIMMSVSFNIPGIAVTLAGISFIIALSQYIPSFSILQFIGNNSIIFYFFSGVIPAMLSNVNVLDGSGVICLSAIGVSIGCGLTWIIVKYIPWLTDFRKLRCLNG